MSISELANEIKKLLVQKPCFFSDIVNNFMEIEYRNLLLAWSEVRSTSKLSRDEDGHYYFESEEVS